MNELEVDIFDGKCLNEKFNDFPLKFYMKNSCTFINVIGKIDLLAVEIDINIINYICEIFGDQIGQDYYKVLV